MQDTNQIKVLVTYFSQTGNTKKVAEAMYEGIAVDKEIRDMRELENLEGYDFIFFGFPVQQGCPAPEARSFLEKHATGKRMALFCTQGAPKDSYPALTALKNAAELCKDSEILGTFNCQGEVADRVIEMMAQKPEVRQFVELAKTTKGRPYQENLAEAKAFAEGIIAKLRQPGCIRPNDDEKPWDM